MILLVRLNLTSYKEGGLRTGTRGELQLDKAGGPPPHVVGGAQPLVDQDEDALEVGVQRLEGRVVLVEEGALLFNQVSVTTQASASC